MQIYITKLFMRQCTYANVNTFAARSVPMDFLRGKLDSHCMLFCFVHVPSFLLFVLLVFEYNLFSVISTCI